MFEAQEAKKPKAQRRKCPQPPPGYMEAMSNVVLVPPGPRGDRDPGGDAVTSSPGHAHGGSGSPRGGFGSTFTAASLTAAMTGATLDPRESGQTASTPGFVPSPGSFTADALNDAAYRHWAENVLETCAHCSRTFTPEALAHHARACTAAKPMKPRGTGLNPGALSRRLEPGSISGTNRPRMESMDGAAAEDRHPGGASGGRTVSGGGQTPGRREPAASGRPSTSAPPYGDGVEPRRGVGGGSTPRGGGGRLGRPHRAEVTPAADCRLTGVAVKAARGPSLGAVQVLENGDWFLARMTIPNCDADSIAVQFSNDKDDRGEVRVEGSVLDAAGGAITREVPVSIVDPGVLRESVFQPVAGAAGEVGELPGAGQWSRTFSLPGPVALEGEGGPRTHYKMLHAPSRLLEMYFWKEKAPGPRVVRSNTGLDSGFG